MKKIKKSDVEQLREKIYESRNKVGLLNSSIVFAKQSIEKYEKNITQYEEEKATTTAVYKRLETEYDAKLAQYEEQRLNSPLTAVQHKRLKELAKVSDNTAGKYVEVPFDIKYNMNMLKPFVFLIEAGYMLGEMEFGYMNEVAITQKGLDKLNE